MTVGPPPPLPPSALLHLLVGLAVLLALARLLGALAGRFGLPAVVGELLTGVLLGPSLLGWLAPDLASWLLPADPAQMHLLDAVGQVGLFLLVALAGTHLDLGALRRQGRTAATVSALGLLLPLAGGVAVGLALGGVLAADGPAAGVFPLFLGVALSVTALPVVAKTFMDMGLLHRGVAQLALAAGAVDDAIAWLLLAVVSAAATTGVAVGQVSSSVAALLAVVLLAAGPGRYAARRVLARAGRSDSDGPTVAAVVVIVLLGALLTQALHLEAIVGAFVAGMVIASTGPAVGARLSGLHTVTLAVLAPVFLALAGLRMDLTALSDPGVLGAAVLVLAVAIGGKFAGAYLAARLCRLSPVEGLALAAAMNARGVVEVIVALAGLRLGIIDTAGYSVIVLVAVVTSLMAPPLLRRAVRHLGENEEERSRAARHGHLPVG